MKLTSFILISLLLSMGALAHVESQIAINDKFSIRPKSSGCKLDKTYLTIQGIDEEKYTAEYNLVNKVLDQLYFSNEKESLEAGYERDDLCIKILKTDVLNAYVSPGTIEDGIIFLTLGSIIRAPNISSIATTIAHELAHLLRNHHGNAHPYLKVSLNNEYFFKKLNKLSFTLKELEASIGQQKIFVKSMIDKTTNKNLLRELINLYKSGPYYYSQNLSKTLSQFDKGYILEELGPLVALFDSFVPNSNSLNFKRRVLNRKLEIVGLKHLDSRSYSFWREVEADEYGLELFVKAGFKKNFFSWRDEQYLEAESLDNINCEQSLLRASGRITHPLPCWRVLNVERELIKHENFYSAYEEELFFNLNEELKNLK
jgi:hypothetical protein